MKDELEKLIELYGNRIIEIEMKNTNLKLKAHEFINNKVAICIWKAAVQDLKKISDKYSYDNKYLKDKNRIP